MADVRLPQALALILIGAVKISKGPAAKAYFMNGDSTQPLPLLNLGDR
jgi:hypothetical protein